MSATVGIKQNLINYIGKEGDFSFTRDTQEVVVHDGVTAGGIGLVDRKVVAGAPSTAPIHIGQLYIDVENLSAYISTGTTDFLDWQELTLGIPDGYIGTDMIANRAVTSAKLAINAVTTDNIAAEAITTTKISLGAITEALIAANAVTAVQLEDGAVIEAKIDNEAITEAKLAANSVSAAKVVAGAIVADAIATNAVTAPKIQAGAIEADKLAANAVTASAIAAGAVVAGKIATGTIQAGDGVISSLSFEVLVGGTLGSDSLFIGTPTLELDGVQGRIKVIDDNNIIRAFIGRIVDEEEEYGIAVFDDVGDPMLYSGAGISYISGAHINSLSANVITTGTLDAEQVEVINLNANNIVTGYLSSEVIAAGTITADKLEVPFLSAISTNIGTVTAGVITADVIVSASIGADQITAGELGADVIYTGTISANKITTGTLSGTLLTGQTINAVTIKSSYITGVKIDGTTINGATINAATLTATDIIGTKGVNQAIYVDGMMTSRTDNHLTLRAISRSSTNGYAVLGTGAYDNGIGVYGISNYPGGRGVIGRCNDVSGWAFYAVGAGGDYGPFTGAHDALLLSTTEAEHGDIMCDHKLIHRRDLSNTLFEIAPSTLPNQPAVGVLVSRRALAKDNAPGSISKSVRVKSKEGGYTDNHVILRPFEKYIGTHDTTIINALGEGQINVCGYGGDIAVGDLITTSSMPGKGMRQADDVVRNYTVAKAREAVTFSTPEEVKQVACIYLCG